MEPSTSFVRLMRGLSEQDQKALTEIYERFIGQMAEWAAHRINGNMQSKIEAQSVAASAMASFFHHYEQGAYDFHHWGGVVKLLSTITIRKCLNRIRELKSQRRDVSREERGGDWDFAAVVLEPESDLITRDLIEHVLKPFEPKKRVMVLARLDGHSAESIAEEHQVSKKYVERAFAEFRERFKEYLSRITEGM